MRMGLRDETETETGAGKDFNFLVPINQAGRVLKKGRKKHELDRPRQAEKKRRRWFKKSLEKKKQRKKDGQETLEEEVASKQKGELARQKQAERKRRRLGKLLANSAAIISELEKKKQKRKEGQQRLDEEVALMAEAVALRVCIG